MLTCLSRGGALPFSHSMRDPLLSQRVLDGLVRRIAWPSANACACLFPVVTVNMDLVVNDIAASSSPDDPDELLPFLPRDDTRHLSE
jgi:hypothetical protein